MNESRKITLKYLRSKSAKPTQKPKKLADDVHFLYSYDLENPPGETANNFLFLFKARFRQRVIEGDVHSEEFKEEFITFLKVASGKAGPFGYSSPFHPLKIPNLWRLCYQVLKETVSESEIIRIMDKLVEATAEYNQRVRRDRSERLLVL